MSNSILFENPNQEVGRGFRMSDNKKIAGQNVKRFRKEAGLSQAKLGKLVGIHQNAIRAIEAGGGSQHMPKIAQVLGRKLSDLDPTYIGEETLTIPNTTATGELLSVYASVEGGNGELVFSNDPVQFVPMPRPLMGIKRGYGVIVKGESMVPLVRPGYTVWVNPHLPPYPTAICVFFNENDGDFTATIKEYCGQTSENWLVKRYQPKERKFQLLKRDWPGCHVVVGADYGR